MLIAFVGKKKYFYLKKQGKQNHYLRHNIFDNHHAAIPKHKTKDQQQETLPPKSNSLMLQLLIKPMKRLLCLLP